MVHKIGFSDLVMEPRNENGMPMKKVKHPPSKHPSEAPRGVLLAIQRAWKSSAATFPNAKIKIVAQFHKMAFGKGDKAR